MSKDFFSAKHTMKGTELSPVDQQIALRAFGHRFTRDHKPQWSKLPRPCGNPYPLQFDSDRDWLANTRFAVTRRGYLDTNCESCESTPTWPDNPELRKQAA